MKKLSFFWILALVICSVISCAEKEQFEQELQTQKREQFKEKLSHEVTQAEARVKLEKLLTKLNIPSTRGGDTNSLPPITSVYTRGKAAVATRADEEVEPYFHIFNFGDNEGFAIMSGDDRVEPLLALTSKGTFNPDEEIDSPGFEYAYKKMEEYYVARVIGGPSIDIYDSIPPRDTLPLDFPVRETREDTLIYHTMNYGYCPVKWHQEEPYNKYCYTLDGETAKTGCVATAVAQLMAIYRYPNSYNGYTFDWYEMRNSAQQNDTIVIDQIARLMQQLGLSNNLGMNYGEDYSLASAGGIPLTFRNFGYANGGNVIEYNSSTVLNELMNGYPILLGGDDGRFGHFWLGHGLLEYRINHRGYNAFDEEIYYQSYLVGYYILYNWGDKLFYDGFFLSGIFDALSTPAFSDPTRSIDIYNYQNDVLAVVGIRKY